jgi:hypothetical protein
MPKRCAICHSHAQPSDVVVAAIERRAEARRDRRHEERRMFPRPAGRRMDDGRRDGDPDRA